MEESVPSIFQFDNLVQYYSILLESSCEKEFLRHVSNQELLRLKWVESINECKELKEKLDAANKNVHLLNNKLSVARRWLDSEKQEKKKLESEKHALIQQLDDVRCIILSDPYYKLCTETQEKLSFLRGILRISPNNYNLSGCKRLKSFIGSDSASDVTNISISRSRDDLDDEFISMHKIRKGPKSSKKSPQIGELDYLIFTDYLQSATPCREINSSSDKFIKRVKYENEKNYDSPTVKRTGSKHHNFIRKSFLMPEYCSWCTGKIGFRQTALKCSECNIITHTECWNKILLPCMPAMATPVKNSCSKFISDYTTNSGPMIPPIVIHCVKEIESRGLIQAGLYRIPGIKSCVRVMNQKFNLEKNLPNLKNFDVYSICHFLLNFLQNLHDPLIPRSKLMMFAEAITNENKNSQLYNAISSLPQANRDTLAFIVLHLQNIASASNCKMPASELASVFGSVIVGCLHDEQLGALIEKHTADTIMEELILFPAYYWSRFICPVLPENNKLPTIHQIQPVADTAEKSFKILITPNSKKKFFNTSPIKD